MRAVTAEPAAPNRAPRRRWTRGATCALLAAVLFASGGVDLAAAPAWAADPLWACAAVGLLSGYLAGLLGIGGGIVIVPLLLLVLPMLAGAGTAVAKMAAATSLAAMVPTTASALLSHWRAGAVECRWLLRLAPGALLGAWLGSRLLPWLDARMVSGIFVIYCACFSARMLAASRGRALAAPWARWPASLVSVAIGLVGVLAGLGGAIFTVPFLADRGVRMSHAVATSTGVAMTLSAGAIASLSTGAVSWIHWPAAIAVALGAMLTAPLGARMARTMPTARLQRWFALLLLLACASALVKLVAA